MKPSLTTDRIRTSILNVAADFALSGRRAMRIAVDAMGGDRGATEVAQGVIAAARRSQASYFLIGDRAVLEAALARCSPHPHNIAIVPATKVIEIWQTVPVRGQHRGPGPVSR